MVSLSCLTSISRVDGVGSLDAAARFREEVPPVVNGVRPRDEVLDERAREDRNRRDGDRRDRRRQQIREARVEALGLLGDTNNFLGEEPKCTGISDSSNQGRLHAATARRDVGERYVYHVHRDVHHDLRCGCHRIHTIYKPSTDSDKR